MIPARCIVFTGVNEVTLGEARVPPPGPGEILVEAIATTISAGTELRTLAGLQGGAVFPLVPGYSCCGRVAATGPGVTTPAVGSIVFYAGTQKLDGYHRVWGGHISHAVLAASAAYPLPAGIDPLHAPLARLAAISYQGLRHSRPLPHETVAVVGLGPIGLLSARLHALTGARVVAADLSPDRCALARASGIETVTPGPDGLPAAFHTLLPQGADVVVDSTGVPALLPQSILICRDKPWDDNPAPGARFLVQGSYPADARPEFPAHVAFMKDVSTWSPRDAQPTSIRAVLDLMARGKLPVADMIGEIRPPDDAPGIYARLRAEKGALLTAVFRW